MYECEYAITCSNIYNQSYVPVCTVHAITPTVRIYCTRNFMNEYVNAIICKKTEMYANVN